MLRRFSRAWRTHEIKSEDLAALKPRSVSCCERIILLQNRLLKGDGLGDAVFVDGMLMIVVMIMMVMVVAVDVKMMMVCTEDLFAGRYGLGRATLDLSSVVECQLVLLDTQFLARDACKI